MLLPLMQVMRRQSIQVLPELCACLGGSSIGPKFAWGESTSSPFLRYFASNNPALSRLSRAQLHREKKKVASRTRSQEPTIMPPEQPVEQPQGGITPSNTKASDLQLTRALGHQALVITRPIEWGTVIFGYEQANRYQIFDESGQMVAQMAEEYEGIANELGRQFLRTRRSFTASVFSADGSQVLFRVKRPVYLVTSTMFIESGDGEVIGEIHRRWSFTNRNYDLYINKSQFASISGGFLAWEFELKDKDGGTLALIDRNFQGLVKEVFTDAGKYVIHFGQPASNETTASTSSSASPPVTAMAKLRTGVKVIPTASGGQIAVARSLELSERMIALACAISIDYDFFSQHSHGSGLISPGIFSAYPGGNVVPVPMPGGEPVIPSEDISGASSSSPPLSGPGPSDSSNEGGWVSEGAQQPEQQQQPLEDAGWSWDDGKKGEDGDGEGGGEDGEGGGGSIVGQVVKGIFGWGSSDE